MNVAHVPVVYQVPPLITQPFCTPPVVTERVPLPDGVLGEVGGLEGVPPVLGRYLIPVAGQSDLDPSEGRSSQLKKTITVIDEFSYPVLQQQMCLFAHSL